MFSKKLHADVKKSTQKIQDVKKDSATRLKHLKIIIDNVETEEAKSFFETNYSHIYYILYDSFVTAEANLRQRELSFHLVHKAHREELECVLHILEKVLIFLPELLSNRWQCHSLTRLMTKLLHPANSWRFRREAIKFFLLWYQALGDNAPSNLNAIFATLVPGFPPPSEDQGLISLSKNSASVFHDGSQGPVSEVEIHPLLLPQSGEKQPEDLTKFYLEALLEFIVTQVTRVEWHDKTLRQHRCFTFLFEKFKQYYLHHIFPQFSTTTSLYKPVLDLPALRKGLPGLTDTPEGRKRQDPYVLCRVSFIKWIASFTHITKRGDTSFVQTRNSSVTPNEDRDQSPGTELRRVSVSQVGSNHDAASPASDSNHSSSFSHSDGGNHSTVEDPDAAAINLVREVLYSNRENVNFVHEIYRQSFLLNFTHSSAIRKTITVYKDWIQMNVPELPSFMLEPLDSHKDDYYRSGLSASEYPSLDGSECSDSYRGVTRLRNDSYLGAIHKENLLVRAGLQNLLHVFITHAANVFLLEVSPDYPLLLEEQVDICKRVLNIYRYMVMHTRMESRTWEQLLRVLLQITSLILSRTPPKNKEETLGGKLAPAIFQTLIVTWIKANLNVVISSQLWDQFLAVLSSLTQWEELIREWAKTLDTLTRVLARHVYNLDLTDLPLDRLTEQKAKKRRGVRQPNSMGELPRSSPSNTRRRGSEVQGKPSYLSQCSAPPEDNCTSFTTSEISAGSFRLRGSSRRHRDSSGDFYLKSSHIPRSASESNLSSCKQINSHKKSSRFHSNAVVIPVLPLSLEQEVARLLASCDSSMISILPRQQLRRKSRSMDSLRGMHSGTPVPYSESEGPTRSPSPAPSSGVESNSIKDSPMQIDVISADGTSLDLNDSGSIERRSVMAGGSIRGWMPDVAVVLWKRMLGSLGDVNRLADPALHHQVFEYLIELCDTLLKIRLNQGITTDQQAMPPVTDLTPPLTIIAPWCFNALMLPASYQKGKLCAYRLLCQMTVMPQDIPLPRDHITHFYKVLHQGLVGTDQAVINTLVQYCGPRFFSLMLPGHSLLLLDFIHAANTVVSSSDLRGTPRTEATSILGALLCLPLTFSELPVLQPNASEFTVMTCSDAKDHILSVLLKCGKREPAGLARCIALSSLGIYVYQELAHQTFHPRVKDAINVLLLALRFNNKTVGQVASDILLLLCDHADILVEHYCEVPPRIIELLALTLSSLMPPPGTPTTEQDKHLLTSLMFCLGEWCMKIPSIYLLTSFNGTSLLLTVFKVLNQVMVGYSNVSEPVHPSGLFQADLIQDFDPNILLDNLKEGITPPYRRRSSAVPPENRPSPSHSKNCSYSVQLAARMVLTHLVNYLGHFPMGIGASRLSSMVSEHDDIPGLSMDELSAEVFSAPNVQLFVLSNNVLMSLVELPTLDVPGGGVTAGMQTASSQVRVILRDLSGKACWDASILYCSPDDLAYVRRLWNRENGDESIVLPVTIVNKVKSEAKKLDESMIPSSLMSHHRLSNSPPQHTLRHRPADILPAWDNGAEDMDNLDDLLQYIGHTSPECLDSLDTPRNIPSAPPPLLTREVEEDTITVVLNQRNTEQEYLQKHESDTIMLADSCSSLPYSPPQSPFQHCRLLFSQLGLAGWEHRSQLHLLAKSEKLLRELRNLDTQRCRETHKIAVIYVAQGQEDKNSILSNTCGSQAYEEFIAGLAWEVELESHNGFLGGLQRNKSTGETAPYYATSFLEVIFHVATRMPSSSQESLFQKTRHLGNDEVHIVWSEHSRDYRRGIIPTEFCDVLIVIYPLPNKLYRIQISRKPEVPYFGPLFNECVVDAKVLPGLVRASAIGASRAKRSMLPFYQNYYEERAKSLHTVVSNYRDCSTFEDFIAQVYCPVQPVSPFYPGPNRSSGTSLGTRCVENVCPATQSSTLAAALLDSPHHRLAFKSGNTNNRVRGGGFLRT